jgi:ferric-dicitrate binding protein FerR (iron transport regulator)
MSAEPLDPLAAARAEFEAWRSARPGRGRLPEHLWNRAIAVLDHYPLAVVSRELRLNSARLKARTTATAPGSRRSRRRVERRHGAFAEVCGAELQARLVPHATIASAPCATPPTTRIVFELPDGTRLLVELAPAAYAHIETLCSALLVPRPR